MPFSPPSNDSREAALLAPYAMRTSASRGRRYPEPEHEFRPLFQRDRERIIHCGAFRRLVGKTQVFTAQSNDHYRTRLTHSLEVAQVSRTIARFLGLHEDLTEAIALSHDIGHPPYGHAGETALNACLKNHGGFDHNLHALRIVDELESPYSGFSGLNLSAEVREAMAWHSKKPEALQARELTSHGLPFLEARVVDLADSMAYNTHDLDDAIGAKLISLEELESLPFWNLGAERVRQRHPALDQRRFRPAVVRSLIEWQVMDLLWYTRSQLELHRVESLDDVRRTPGLVSLSPGVQPLVEDAEKFLLTRVYRHPTVVSMAEAGQRQIKALYDAYLSDPKEMSLPFVEKTRTQETALVAGDYISGMTDRFVRKEAERLFKGDSSVR